MLYFEFALRSACIRLFGLFVYFIMELHLGLLICLNLLSLKDIPIILSSNLFALDDKQFNAFYEKLLACFISFIIVLLYE